MNPIIFSFLKENLESESALEDVITKRLLIYWVGRIWGERLIDLAPVKVEGREYLDTARVNNKGIILARFHQRFGDGDGQFIREARNRASPLMHWLNREGLKPMHTIGLRQGVEQGLVTEKISNTRDLLEANRILRKGGCVQILPDGPHGDQGVNIVFMGYRWLFRAGFAELALLTQATVVPISLSFQIDGSILIKIWKPLQIKDGLTREAQIENLVNQYVEDLSDFWRNNFHMIKNSIILRHIRLGTKVGN